MHFASLFIFGLVGPNAVSEALARLYFASRGTGAVTWCRQPQAGLQRSFWEWLQQHQAGECRVFAAPLLSRRHASLLAEMATGVGLRAEVLPEGAHVAGIVMSGMQYAEEVWRPPAHSHTSLLAALSVRVRVALWSQASVLGSEALTGCEGRLRAWMRRRLSIAPLSPSRPLVAALRACHAPHPPRSRPPLCHLRCQ